MAEDQRWYYLFGTTPLWKPFWGIFGDFDIGEIEDYTGHNMPTRTLAPVLMWVYMMIATVILVNLLIAQVPTPNRRSS